MFVKCWKNWLLRLNLLFTLYRKPYWVKVRCPFFSNFRKRNRFCFPNNTQCTSSFALNAISTTNFKFTRLAGYPLIFLSICILPRFFYWQSKMTQDLDEQSVKETEKSKLSEKKPRQPDTWWSWVVCAFGATSVLIVLGCGYCFGILLSPLLDEFKKGKSITGEWFDHFWVGVTTLMATSTLTTYWR